MPSILTTPASRRHVLRTAASLSSLGGAMPFALQLAAIGSASAQTLPAGDYRAIVCVFLYGGNDAHNTVVPTDPAAHAAYRGARTPIARDRATLVPLAGAAGDPPLGMPPELAAFAAHCNAGHAAVVANVGPLVEPTTRAQLLAGAANVPPKLYSHNDQQSTWQANATEGASSGWGGRIGDVLASANTNQTFTCMSIAGNAVFLSGQASTQYQVTPAGAVRIEPTSRGSLYGSSRAPALLDRLVRSERTHLLERDQQALVRRSIAAREQLDVAFGSGAPTLATPVPQDNALAGQLRMVARTIAARQALGVRRQVFFVSAGGFDTHAFQNASHPPLLQQLGDALDSFYRTTVEMGVASQVTTFTASDFGRALVSNGDGSDHGWGAHHLVIGGAVRGGRTYGRFPTVAVGAESDSGQGRLLPTTSVDQYASTLARWMGVAPAALPDILPNVGRFAANGLEFLA